MLLGRRCSDYDIATSATPRQVKRLFRHVLLIGAKFGVAMVIVDGRKVEVTTFRSDVSYSDGRRPDAVTFATPHEDAERRDFTINGMFHDPLTGRTIDYVGGQKDLASGVVRTIGKAADRFAEDYLRMLRAVRFTVQLDFRIDPVTAAAVRKHAGKITSISGERILDELGRMLSIGSAGRALRLMDKLGLARAILPDLFADGLWPRALPRVEAVAQRKDLVLTLGALLCELSPGTIQTVCRRWGASNELRDGLCFLAGHLDDWAAAPSIPLCDFKRLLANKHFHRLRVLWRLAERDQTNSIVCAKRIARRAAGIAPGRIAPRPLLSGKDLKQLGLREGPRLGGILERLYDAQLNEVLHTRAAAMKAAREMIER